MPQQVEVKEEAMELMDPTTSCCASSSTEGPCSQELVDVNSLTQVEPPETWLRGKKSHVELQR